MLLLPNTAPVAVVDAYAATEDTTAGFNVAAPQACWATTLTPGDTLTAVVVTADGHGTLTLNANGSFTYTPDANFNGTDSFTYKANDGAADSNVATVTITVKRGQRRAGRQQRRVHAPTEDTPLTVAARACWATTPTSTATR